VAKFSLSVRVLESNCMSNGRWQTLYERRK